MKKSIIVIASADDEQTQTFLSAQAIVNYAKEQEWQVKLEILGNESLTLQDIVQADVIIIVAEQDIDLSRFKGKPIYRTSTLNAIKHTAQECLYAFEKAEIYTGERYNALVKEALDATTEKTYLGKCAVKKGAHRGSLMIIVILVISVVIYSCLD